MTELRPASDWSNAELAAIFTAGFAEYVVPMNVDEAGFARTVEVTDIDLHRSVVAVQGGEPVGIGLLAFRGDRAYCAGLGVVPAARRTGVGKRAMEALIEVSAGAELTTEVIESNEPAVALYESLGFTTTRILEVWSLEASGPRTSRATPAEVDEAHALIVRHRRSPEPWQRADETLANLRRRGDSPEGLVVGEDGGILYRVVGDRVAVLQLGARDEATAEELLDAARACGESLLFVNLPEGDVASGAFAALSAKLELRQLELALARGATQA